MSLFESQDQRVINDCPVCGNKVDHVESVAERVYHPDAPRVPTGEERFTRYARWCGHKVEVTMHADRIELTPAPHEPAESPDVDPTWAP